MTNRGDTLAKRTLPKGRGKGVVASSLPLFDADDLQKLRKERQAMIHRLTHQRMDAHSRIRTQQKLHLLVAKIMRLEMQIGGVQ